MHTVIQRLPLLAVAALIAYQDGVNPDSVALAVPVGPMAVAAASSTADSAGAVAATFDKPHWMRFLLRLLHGAINCIAAVV